MAKGNEVIMYLLADNKDLKAKLSSAEKSLEQMQKKTEQKAGGIGSALKKIGAAVAGYFGVQAVRSFINFAGEVDSVSRSFYNLAAGAQGGGAAVLSAMREASAGTMSQLDMMKSANLAMQLMGDDVIQHLPQMARVARAAAQASGKDVSFMLESLVVASGRQSTLVLDNLGISSSTASRYMAEYARSIGTSTDRMTAAQKSQAFFFASMRAGQELVDRVGLGTLTLGEQLQKMKSTTTDAAAAFAEGLIPGLYNAIAAFDDASGAGNGVTNMLREMGKWISRAITGWAELANFIRMFKSLTGAEDNMRRTADATRRVTEYQAELNRRYGDWRRATATELQERQRLMDIANGASRATLDQLGTTVTLANTIQGAYDRVENGQRRSTAATRRQTQAIREQQQAAGKLRDGMADYYAFLGMEEQADQRRMDQTVNRLSELFRGNQEMLDKIQEAMAARSEELARKHNVFMNSLQQGFSQSIQTAMGSFESATKDALKRTLTGEGGWQAWKDAMHEILMQLVADLMYAVAKALLLKAITTAIGGPSVMGSSFLGGVIKGAFFEKGYIPAYSRGRIPVLQSGLMPADHFPAYIGTREAVINAQSTAANAGLLKWINDNPGQQVQAQSVITHTVLNLDGKTLTEVVDRHQAGNARARGTTTYQRRG